MADANNLSEQFKSKVKFEMKNVPVYYAKIFPDNIDEYEGKERYKLTIGIDPERAEKMEGHGFNVKYDDDGNAFVDAFRNKMIKKNTKELPPPTIRFEDGSAYSLETNGYLGNGSICNIHVAAQYVKVGKNWHLPLYLEEIEVIEHVPYGGESQDADDVL